MTTKAVGWKRRLDENDYLGGRWERFLMQLDESVGRMRTTIKAVGWEYRSDKNDY